MVAPPGAAGASGAPSVLVTIAGFGNGAATSVTTERTPAHANPVAAAVATTQASTINDVRMHQGFHAAG